MDNQLHQTRTHTQGNESDRVLHHVCNKCGWSYPNPHPSAKLRRAHKKICGTIQGYKICVLEGQTHFNCSDEEHVSDVDHKIQGERLVRLRSEDEVFSDAFSHFSDGGLSPRTKELLEQDSLDSGTSAEQVGAKDPDFSRSSKNSDFVNDGSQLIFKSSNGCQIQYPDISQTECVEVESNLDLQGQLSGSIVDVLPSSIADLRTEEAIFVHTNDFFDLPNDSYPCKAEVFTDVFPENKIYAVENMIDCSLVSIAKETILIGNNEIKSHTDMVENVDSPNNIVDEPCEGVPDIVVSGAISLDCHIADETINGMENNSVEFLSVQAQDDFPLALNSVEIINVSTNVQVELAHVKQFSSSSDVNVFQFSPDIYVVSSINSVKKEPIHFANIETNAEENAEVSPPNLTPEGFDRLDETDGSMNAIQTEINESHIITFAVERGTINGCKDSQQISLPERSLEASSIANPRDASFASTNSETIGVISIYNGGHHEKNRTEINDAVVYDNNVRANVENDSVTKRKDLKPSELLHLEAKRSRDLVTSDDAGEMSKIEICDITESSVISEAVVDGTTRKGKALECANGGPVSASREDIKEDEINSNIKTHEEYNRSVDPLDDSYHAQDAELLVKAAGNFVVKYTSLSSVNSDPSAQHNSSVEDKKDGKVYGITAVPMPVQDRSVNNLVKHSSSGLDASVNSGSRFDSLDGSVSVILLQSDAPAAIDTETLPSTSSLASTEAGKSNMNNPIDSFYRQQSAKLEMSEPPSFMTLVEPGHVTKPIVAASEVQKGSKTQQPDETHVISKEHKPLKSLLGEAAQSDKAKPPMFGGHSFNQKKYSFLENNNSGSKTVNSILGSRSPAAHVAKEWNSPARYPADIKREKGKVKSRPFWIQLVCCSSSMDHMPQRK